MATSSYNKHKSIPLNRLHDLREEADMTKSYVADLLGNTIGVVSHHENRARGISHQGIMRYCEIFRCYSYELFHPIEENGANNRLRGLKDKSRLTYEEIFKLTGIPTQRIINQHKCKESLTHADILAYARVFKCYTHEIFVDAEYTPNAWEDQGILPIEDEEQFADPILYDTLGRIPIERNYGGGKTRVEQISRPSGGRVIKGWQNPELVGKRARRIPVEDR